MPDPPGGLEVGDRADLVQFEPAQSAEGDAHDEREGFRVLCTVVDGEPVWGSPENGKGTILGS